MLTVGEREHQEQLVEWLSSALYDAWEAGVTTEEQTDTVAEWLAPRLSADIARAERERVLAEVERELAVGGYRRGIESGPQGPFRALDRVRARLRGGEGS